MPPHTITIIDYGMGNLGSIRNMLKHINIPVEISSDPAVIRDAEKLILAGVGSFDSAVGRLVSSGMIKSMEHCVLQQRTPILGICLGMQLFTRKSQEGDMAGLGWVDAETVRLEGASPEEKLIIPHMGWNYVSFTEKSRLFTGFTSKPRFYFVHSYHVTFSSDFDNTATVQYGREFVCAFEKDNIYGVQFHPEKSHSFGMALLRNFSEI